ncbi:class I SAM-dependent methyltransferase [Rosettibacter firmus]|uniref:class I SAM-dependent methyltransferase n=1 Tax=Rosettibacter firmus TaxID=3111522 RepID=UPI00336BC80E
MIKKILSLIKTKDLKYNLGYWENPDENNNPVYYLDNNNTNERTIYLINLINKWFPDKNIKILEIGSNVGRNLNYLYKNGYKKLTGIEINKEAIKLMSIHYKQCYDNVIIINDAVENVIKKIKQNEYDLIFTMAVLEHIHKKSEWIFNEMIRITNNIITIEDEKSISWKHFPRNYKRVFKNMKQIYWEDCSYIKGFNKGFTTRIFTKL